MEPTSPNLLTTSVNKPTPSDPPLHRLRLKKRWLVIIYALLIFLTASFYVILSMFLDEQTAKSGMILYLIAISVVPFLWCKYDAMQHKKRLDFLTGTLIILMSFFGIAVYYGKIRRRSFGECASIFVLLSLIYTGLIYAGAFAFENVYYALGFDAVEPQ